MPSYEKYTTTVVGAHSVPRWYEPLGRLVASGQLAAGDFADAQLRASEAAGLDQEIAGIDVITSGEMHRRTHNRHAPPNAMLSHTRSILSPVLHERHSRNFQCPAILQ